MTGRTLSSAAQAAILDEESDEVSLHLVTIEHDDLDAPIRIVDNIEDITSNGETFVGLPFRLELPDEGDRPGEARITVDNVDRRIAEAVRSITTPPSVTIQVVLASQPDTLELELSGMTLRDVTIDAGAVTGYLRFEDLSVEPIAEAITPSKFPGLF